MKRKPSMLAMILAASLCFTNISPALALAAEAPVETAAEEEGGAAGTAATIEAEEADTAETEEPAENEAVETETQEEEPLQQGDPQDAEDPGPQGKESGDALPQEITPEETSETVRPGESSDEESTTVEDNEEGSDEVAESIEDFAEAAEENTDENGTKDAEAQSPDPETGAGASLENEEKAPFKGTVSIETEGQSVTPGEKDGQTPDDLFATYVDNAFAHKTYEKKRGAKSAGSNLTGINAAIYSNIVAVLPAIAAGERASTEFEIPVNELGLDKTYWTAAELGVESIFVLDENGDIYIDEEGSIVFTEDAIAAAQAKTAYDLLLITGALMADFPYQLYWYEKTQETMDTGIYMTGGYSEAAGDYVLEIVDSITISFPVAEEYTAGEYTVDTSVGQSVQTAVSNADAIVTKYSYATDYDKLAGYKDDICDLVSYNFEAAGGSVSYGNPWQMIWVFDGDPDTNVVCEGYSKAFKYLCDQSAFSGDISCITVSGTMYDDVEAMEAGADGEPHMWNIVNMEDGNNYLVDVTNCDEGAIGAPDQLFLKGYATGYEGYRYDFECNARYLDEEDPTTYTSDRLVYVYDTETRDLYNIKQLILSGPSYAHSQTFYSGNYAYELSDEKAIITKYSGTEENVIVPSAIDDHQVYRIAGAVFKDNKYIKTITFSEGIQELSMGTSGFSGPDTEDNCCILGCTSLTGISLPSTFTIDDHYFEKIGLGNFIDSSSTLETIEISPDNPYLTVQGNILYTKDMKTLILCPNRYESFTIPEGVEKIYDYAFAGNKSIKNIDLPKGLKIIGSWAFYECTGLEEVSIPDSCIMIGQNLFSDSKIEEIFIPGNVNRILEDAFNGMRELKSITVSPQNPIYSSRDGVLFKGSILVRYPIGREGDSYVVDEDINEFTYNAFENCKNLREITIPYGVEELPYGLFYNCTNLQKLVLPASLKKIDNGALANVVPSQIFFNGTIDEWESINICNNTVLAEDIATRYFLIDSDSDIYWACYHNAMLVIEGNGALPDFEEESAPWERYKTTVESLSIEEGIQSIGKFNFSDWVSLSSVSLPKSLLLIKTAAFKNDSNLMNVYYKGSETEWDSVVVEEMNEPLLSAELHFDSSEIHKGKCGDTAEWTMSSDGTLTICGTGEMYDLEERWNPYYSEVTKVIVEQGITRIGDNAFRGFSLLESVQLPDSLEEIGYMAFRDCENLSDIELPIGLISLDSYVFFGCKSIKRCSIPESVTSIGSSVFIDCKRLEEIEVSNHNSCYRSVDGVLFDHDLKTLVSFPCARRGVYEVPDSIIEISSGSFRGALIDEVIISSPIDHIEGEVFNECENLTSIILPDSVKSIGTGAFNNCFKLQEIILPSSLESIEGGAFQCCRSLSEIFIPEGVKRIGDYAFNSCDQLADIYFMGDRPELFERTFGTIGETAAYYPADNDTWNSGDLLEYEHFTWHGFEIFKASSASCTTNGYSGDLVDVESGKILRSGNIIPATGHDWGEWTVVREATEEEEGLERRTCRNNPSHTEERIIPELNHVHNLVKTEDKPATCTENGNIAYWMCSKCGRLYLDANGAEETIIEETVIPAGGHNWSEEYTVDREPSCSEEGSESIHCTVCGEIKEGSARAIEKLAHTYGEWEIVKVATCTEAGSRRKVCSGCGDTITEEISAIGHDWGEWIVIREATEEEEGLERRTCRNDASHMEERSIPKLNHVHDLVKTEDKPATCTENGNIAYWTCSKCGKIYLDANGAEETNLEEIVIPATGHRWSEEYTVDRAPTCSEEGSESIHCTVCGEIKEGSARAIEKLAHSYGEWEIVKAATCTEAGSRRKVCSVCGDTVTEETSATGHDWGEWAVVREATEEEEGLERRTCRNDASHTEEQSIPKLNHVHDLVKTEDKPATCTESGNLAYWTCSKCGKIYLDANGAEESSLEEVVIPAAGHRWSEEFTVDKEPTNTEEGSKSIHCGVCDAIKEGSAVSIPKLEQLGKTARGDLFNLANNIKVTWEAVPGAKYYKVYRNGVSEPVIVTKDLVGWDNCTTPALEPGKMYTYKIVASLTDKGDPSGDSPLSYSKSIYRLKTTAFKYVKNTAPGKVTASYKKSDYGDSYVLLYADNADMKNAKSKVIYGADTTAVVLGGFTKGKTYWFQIRVRKSIAGYKLPFYTTFGTKKSVTITK